MLMNAKKNKMKNKPPSLRRVVQQQRQHNREFYLVLGWRAMLDLDTGSALNQPAVVYSAWFLLKILHLLKK